MLPNHVIRQMQIKTWNTTIHPFEWPKSRHNQCKCWWRAGTTGTLILCSLERLKVWAFGRNGRKPNPKRNKNFNEITFTLSQAQLNFSFNAFWSTQEIEIFKSFSKMEVYKETFTIWLNIPLASTKKTSCSWARKANFPDLYLNMSALQLYSFWFET